MAEFAEECFFGGQRDGGVVFDGVEAAEGEVEYARGEEEVGVELLDDEAEGAAGLVEEVEACFCGLAFGLVGGCSGW